MRLEVKIMEIKLFAFQTAIYKTIERKLPYVLETDLTFRFLYIPNFRKKCLQINIQGSAYPGELYLYKC